jgi:hypothetical protein
MEKAAAAANQLAVGMDTKRGVLLEEKPPKPPPKRDGPPKGDEEDDDAGESKDTDG